MKTLVMAIATFALVGNSFAGDPLKSKLSSDKNNIIEVSVYDASGVLVLEDNTVDEEISFDMSDMRSGDYRVEVKSEGELVNSTLVSHKNTGNAMQVRVIDEDGRMIHHAAGDDALNFDLDAFPAGEYKVQVFIDADLVNSSVVEKK